MTERGQTFDSKSIADLCAPVSATVLPEAAHKTWFGQGGLNTAQIIGMDRNAQANKFRRKQKRGAGL